jgi:hypothetical protein
MEDKRDVLSYFAVEGIMTHFTFVIRRLIVTIIVILVLWAATIAGFIWYLSLPVEVTSDISVENQDGNANYIGNDMNGDFNYGESAKNNQNP